MEILEFGDTGKKKVILIHGFQSPYQVWNRYIEHYKKDFHIIVPILPGHNLNRKEEFVSFAETARELEDYYISHYGDNVYAVYGMSMGGVLTAALWQNGRLGIDKVIFDGSPLVSVNIIIKKWMQNFYIKITEKTRQRDRKTLEQAVKSIITPENLDNFLKVLDNMSDNDIKKYLNSIYDFMLSKDNDMKSTKVYYFHGTALNETLAKKTANFIMKNYPDANVKCFNGKGHCEVMLFQPEVMLRELDNILR